MIIRGGSYLSGIKRSLSSTQSLYRKFYSNERKTVSLPDHLIEHDTISAPEWKKKFGQHKDDIHYTRESTEQFDLKPVSDEHFKIRKIKLENQEYEIKEIPTIPFRVNEDPLSEENAFDGIYDMIDIMGDDPSVTPAQLCHGHKVYRGVDLGISPHARDQTGTDPRKHIAELRTLYRIKNYNKRFQFSRVDSTWETRFRQRVNYVNRVDSALHG